MYRLLFTALLLTSTACFAQSNEQIVEAIYRIEGGNKAQYAYGIRSVHYKDKAEARRICLRTVQNNRLRYAQAITRGFKGDYIRFLASRYCPTNGRLSRAEQRLNGNWEKNLRRVLQ